MATYLASQNHQNWMSSTLIILIQVLLEEVDVVYHSGYEHLSQLTITVNCDKCNNIQYNIQ